MKFLSLKEVCRMIGVSRATIYRWVAAQMFPQPKKLSAHRSGRIAWVEQDVVRWMSARPPAGNTPTP